MNINDLTIGQAKEIAALFPAGIISEPSNPYPVGKNVFIRTVTNYLVGLLVEVHDQELVLEGASWVADTGRYATALETGVLNEVEPYPAGRVVVGRGAIIDCCTWAHELPKAQK